MIPIESQPTGKASEERGKSVRRKWSPTQQAFEKLLASFSSDRDEAGKQYELVRLKLIRFFERRTVVAPERHVDETLDRVMRRIDEGETITNLVAYCYKVASYIFMEELKEQEQSRTAADAIPLQTAALQLEPVEESPRLLCFDRCLDGLPVESRILILDYYREEGRAKIQLRKQTAQKLGIPLNALRIRAHRIRVGLENCVEQCLARAG